MRIAVTNHNRNIIGGKETYLRRLLPALASRGHEVAFWHQAATAIGHEVIELPDGAPVWSAAESGAASALADLRRWQPDVIYAHGLDSPELEAETHKIAPTIFFAHEYYGSCVSGTKTFSFPQPQPCDRKFGWQCLLHYYPRRCGGLSPLTMLRDYERQAKRLALLRECRLILVASSHMQREYEKYGLANRIRKVRLPVTIEEQVEDAENKDGQRNVWRLLFMSRMETLKGGAYLLEALPEAARVVNLPLNVTLTGDGRRRQEWEQHASQLAAANPNLSFEFTGWLDEPSRRRVLQRTDLLIMPSLWPEPFGLAGAEAGLFGVPVVAFAVGGIPDWLHNGLNGVLAKGDPPSVKGLADAIVKCTSDEKFYQSLRRGAREQAQQFNMKDHLDALLEIFEGQRKYDEQ
jgi:glycosyltransferase involved in cell wall biosynthesis